MLAERVNALYLFINKKNKKNKNKNIQKDFKKAAAEDIKSNSSSYNLNNIRGEKGLEKSHGLTLPSP